MSPKLFFSINLLFFGVLHGMQNKEPQQEIKHSWEGSCEQCGCYWSGCVTALALEVYLVARMTPTEEHPFYHGFWGNREISPEHEQLLGLIPLAAVLAGATKEKPDHCCCWGKTRLGFRAVKNACDRFFITLRASSGDWDNLEIGFYDDVPVVPMVKLPVAMPRAGVDEAKKKD